ncbi:unnamed protein product [Adineta steineri]|uniref:Uncharacterized protein n=1 Tax=Adineta steineri TaxID=433720 RepID=A0A819MFS5_9BILA|nr:unnamed protein product [Adineta steineri]CAF3979180.1 unnamed protein product [Adineta steineri]
MNQNEDKKIIPVGKNETDLLLEAIQSQLLKAIEAGKAYENFVQNNEKSPITDPLILDNLNKLKYLENIAKINNIDITQIQILKNQKSAPELLSIFQQAYDNYLIFEQLLLLHEKKAQKEEQEKLFATVEKMKTKEKKNKFIFWCNGFLWTFTSLKEAEIKAKVLLAKNIGTAHNDYLNKHNKTVLDQKGVEKLAELEEKQKQKSNIDSSVLIEVDKNNKPIAQSTKNQLSQSSCGKVTYQYRLNPHDLLPIDQLRGIKQEWGVYDAKISIYKVASQKVKYLDKNREIKSVQLSDWGVYEQYERKLSGVVDFDQSVFSEGDPYSNSYYLESKKSFAIPQGKRINLKINSTLSAEDVQKYPAYEKTLQLIAHIDKLKEKSESRICFDRKKLKLKIKILGELLEEINVYSQVQKNFSDLSKLEVKKISKHAENNNILLESDDESDAEQKEIDSLIENTTDNTNNKEKSKITDTCDVITAIDRWKNKNKNKIIISEHRILGSRFFKPKTETEKFIEKLSVPMQNNKR